jgi:ABC-2 type transport system permease protein
VPKALKIAVDINPLSYGVDGLRGAMSQGFLFGLGTDFIVLSILTAILLFVGSYFFSRIQL